MNKYTTLEIVINLKDRLEKMITDINSNNPQTNQNSNAVQLKQQYQNQLILFKLAIQKGNLKRHGWFGVRNAQWIYKRSELQREITRLNSINLIQKKDKSNRITLIEKLNKEIKEITIRLNKFNNTTHVWIKLDKDLGL